eukprot:CAMPEP_0196769930 /NCGR_PEP_ID=MMETSP1104-20130614/832_1 /TAXON_ID=33652 /ORGANISM="Cafeteria sp., Strain Caron Lab Isolate" /LENGTH=162 /DNA_ID=CAMNT_0042140033 /DNA_START=46 /DNA_END=534 /DNA_ORIENTATION=+
MLLALRTSISAGHCATREHGVRLAAGSSRGGQAGLELVVGDAPKMGLNARAEVLLGLTDAIHPAAQIRAIGGDEEGSLAVVRIYDLEDVRQLKFAGRGKGIALREDPGRRVKGDNATLLERPVNGAAEVDLHPNLVVFGLLWCDLIDGHPEGDRVKLAVPPL